MSPIAVAALYIGALGVLLIVLALLVVRQRQRARVSTGDGGDALLRNAMRAHGNATENIPMMAALLIVLALLPAPTPLIHAFGAICVIARILQAMGLSANAEGTSPPRFLGTLLSFLTIMAMGAAAIFGAFMGSAG